MATKTTKAAKKTETEELKSKSVYLRGVITEAMYGKRSFGKGSDSKEKYRISLKVVPDDMDKLIEEAEPYYEETNEKWLPKWYTDENARDFLNLSSNFDIKIGKKTADGVEDCGTMMQFIEANGNINGSEVVLMVTLKPGAIYPQAILIKKLHTQTIGEMFNGFMDLDGDEELPFT